MKAKVLLRDIGVVVGALVIGGGIMYGIMHYQQQSMSQNKTVVAQKESEKEIDEIGKLMLLPKEIPTVATVSDISKLKDQAFFASAKNGDVVLVYTQAKEAILYRPSINKIIRVAPVNNSVSPTPQQTTIPTLTPTIPVFQKKATNTPVPVTPTQ